MTRTLPSRCIFALLLLTGLLQGCAEVTQWVPFGQPPPIEAEYVPEQVTTMQDHDFYLTANDSVVGQLASVPVQEGDSLLDIARHFGVGYQHIAEANPDIDLWAPRQGERAVLPLQFILPDAPRKGIVINLAAMRLFYFQGGKQSALSTWPIGIGKEGRSTPLGVMSVQRKMEHPTWYVPESIRRAHAQYGDILPSVVPPGPNNPLGDYALYLSKPAYLIHGTDKPFSIGLRASNGCIRLYPEDIKQAFQEIPNGTPVVIVNQPYLLGWLDGMLYLEAHQPFEEIDPAQARDNLLAKLRQIVKKQGRRINWQKVETVLKQARGIPVPILEGGASFAQRLAAATRLERPLQLFGQPPPLPPLKPGWLVRTPEVDNDFSLKRLAAQLNHLGPRIPARVSAKNKRYQLIAGPFADENAARKVQLTLGEDFGTASEMVKPAAKSGTTAETGRPAKDSAPGKAAKPASGATGMPAAPTKAKPASGGTGVSASPAKPSPANP